jgi:hypothetical protein
METQSLADAEILSGDSDDHCVPPLRARLRFCAVADPAGATCKLRRTETLGALRRQVNAFQRQRFKLT